MFTNIRLGLAMMLVLAGCGAGPNNFGDAGDPPDGDLGGDAADDHKVGFKPDTGSDADTSDASDAGPTGDANPQDSGGTTGPRRVFVTFKSYAIGKSTGQFSGIGQADAICQAAATSQALGGTWKAWMSSSAGSVAQRFTHTGGPFKMLDGTVIAKDWTELTSGTLQNKPSVDETGHVLADQWAWTGTYFDGTAASSSCNDWTSNSSVQTVKHGSSDQTGTAWSGDFDAGTDTTCGDGMGLYCFEQ